MLDGAPNVAAVHGNNAQNGVAPVLAERMVADGVYQFASRRSVGVLGAHPRPECPSALSPIESRAVANASLSRQGEKLMSGTFSLFEIERVDRPARDPNEQVWLSGAELACTQKQGEALRWL